MKHYVRLAALSAAGIGTGIIMAVRYDSIGSAVWMTLVVVAFIVADFANRHRPDPSRPHLGPRSKGPIAREAPENPRSADRGRSLTTSWPS